MEIKYKIEMQCEWKCISNYENFGKVITQPEPFKDIYRCKEKDLNEPFPLFLFFIYISFFFRNTLLNKYQKDERIIYTQNAIVVCIK